MPDVLRHAAEKNVGVAALETPRHREFGDGVAPPQIFAQEQGVDLRRIAAHDDILEIVRKNLRLREVTAAQEVGNGTGLAPHVVQRVGGKGIRIVQVGLLDAASEEVGSRRLRIADCGLRICRGAACCNPEMFRHVLQAEAVEFARADIIKLREEVRVDDVAYRRTSHLG